MKIEDNEEISIEVEPSDYPFLILEKGVMEIFRELGVTPAQKATYFALLYFSDNKKKCQKEHKELAAMSGLSKTTLIDSLKALEEMGLVEIECNYDEDGGRLPNTYFLKDCFVYTYQSRINGSKKK